MKFKFTKLITALFLIFLFPNYCYSQNEKTEIVVGLDVNVPPMGFIDSSGKIVGFDIDLATEVFKNMGKKVKFQPIDWDSKELELESGNIDVIWNGLSKTPEREQSMLLTRPYMKNRQVVIVKKGSLIHSISDLKDKNICVQKGSAAAGALYSHFIFRELKNVNQLENMVNCLNEVDIETSEATVVDETVAKYYLAKEGLENKFEILDDEISSEYYVIATKKGNYELKNKIEEQLDFLYTTGQASKISNKWFSQDLFFWENLVSENTEIKSNELQSFNILIQGLINTLKLFFIVIILSLPLGFLICLIRISKNKIIKAVSICYINVLRGTPLLLQLFFIFYGLPYVPFIGFSFKNRFLAASVAFVLNYAAYFAEIFRGGFLSIDKGQVEAAKVLGFTRRQTMIKILIPQLLKVTLPPICNEAITLIKDSALIYAIGIQELLTNAKTLVNASADVTPYILAGAIYMSICGITTVIFRRIEKKISF